MRARAWGPALILVVGCQTTGPKTPARLPAILGPLFVGCHPGDGASSVQAFEDGKLLGSVEAEWVAKPTGDWDVEVTNPVGQIVLTATRRGDQVSFTGPLARRVPEVGVRKDGFLEIGGHMVALKAGEVPCLLAYGFPRGWLSLLDSVEAGGQGMTADFSGPERAMELKTSGLGGGRKDGRACSAVTWRKFLWMQNELDWCVSMGPRREAELSGLSGYSLRLADIDERR